MKLISRLAPLISFIGLGLAAAMFVVPSHSANDGPMHSMLSDVGPVPAVGFALAIVALASLRVRRSAVVTFLAVAAAVVMFVGVQISNLPHLISTVTYNPAHSLFSVGLLAALVAASVYLIAHGVVVARQLWHRRATQVTIN